MDPTLDPASIHQWVHRGRLDRGGTDLTTQETLWSFGDVKQLQQQAIMNKARTAAKETQAA